MRFLRRVWSNYSKLGRKRRKLQKWRKPTGRDNKMREKRKGRPAVVSIGYGKNSKVKRENARNLIVVSNVKDIENVKKGNRVMIAKMGKKKKIEIAKVAKERGIVIENLNVKKILKKMEKKNEPKK